MLVQEIAEPKRHAKIAEFEAKPPKERTLDHFLKRVEAVAIEHREEKGKKGDKTAAASVSGRKQKFKGKCHYCGKDGHKESECKKKIADQKAGRQKTKFGMS